MNPSLLSSALVYIIACGAAILSCAAQAREVSEKTPTPSLQYYVQVELGAPDFQVGLPALNQTSSAQLGQINVFDLNVTEGFDRFTSQCLGSVRGYTVETSYVSGEDASRAVEVELLTYNDGRGVEGTISMQGVIKDTPNEIAIVGGTGSFRGVRGYAAIDIAINDTLPYLVYHHSLYFL